MKALRLYGVQDIRYEDVEEPKIEEDLDVIIEVKAVGICGSDLSRYRKLGPYIEGMVWGHEFSGVVKEIGSGVMHVAVGDRVAGCPSVVCHICEFCQKAEYARCENLSVVGAYRPGAFAEYIKLSAEAVVPVADNVSYEEAAMIEPSSVVAHGYFKTAIQPGAEIAVMGCGNIGLLAIQWAKIFGAERVFAIDIDHKKLTMAKQAGADVCLNPKDGPACEQLREYTKGVDLAIESAGSPITSAQVLALPKKGGEVVYLGIPYGDVPVERFYFEQIVRNELTIKGSWNCISAPFPGKEWTVSLAKIVSKELDLTSSITHRLALSKGSEIFERMTNGTEDIGKVMLFPEWDKTKNN